MGLLGLSRPQRGLGKAEIPGVGRRGRAGAALSGVEVEAEESVAAEVFNPVHEVLGEASES